jgi:hypothetical protein
MSEPLVQNRPDQKRRLHPMIRRTPDFIAGAPEKKIQPGAFWGN